MISACQDSTYVLLDQNTTQIINSSYTDEDAQDAVGSILKNTSDIKFRYNDGLPGINFTLSTTGVAANTYGTASAIPRITVDSKGRITAVTTNAVAGPKTYIQCFSADKATADTTLSLEFFPCTTSVCYDLENAGKVSRVYGVFTAAVVTVSGNVNVVLRRGATTISSTTVNVNALNTFQADSNTISGSFSAGEELNGFIDFAGFSGTLNTPVICAEFEYG